MDRSACKAIVERELEPLMRRLGIPHWRLTVEYDLKDDETLGNCSAMPDYEKAQIKFNPGLFETETELVKTLRHELFHVILSPYDVYREAVNEIEIDAAARVVLTRLWTHLIEHAVIHLERMYQGLTDTPAASRMGF